MCIHFYNEDYLPPWAIENKGHGQIATNVFWLCGDYIVSHHDNKYMGTRSLLSFILLLYAFQPHTKVGDH
jgi:hypothetical protein